ncbi:hypothetical protein HHK36_018770 [Tetracentron sinense]|uniref:Uncharacterized protein n=1 Tax=Tetracentron sinense TaxID=13715 RepID=A0A835DC65_TETSI|nr:hypothetical protein HHK36_018770 [Tetracentron sinense]
MGDLQVWSPPWDGISTEERIFPSSWSSSSFNPHPLLIGADCWLRAEQTTQKIIWRIQPTMVSEQRRKEVIDYVQSLIRGHLGSQCKYWKLKEYLLYGFMVVGEVVLHLNSDTQFEETAWEDIHTLRDFAVYSPEIPLLDHVFPFGSVPLKTYLPDGDIDLTVLSSQNVEDSLDSDVRAILEGEEQNKAAEYEVKDIQYVHAEVKLVKCLIQNIVVDISFNQLEGLCSLCFLEQVDLFIGKEHLFKRSIILIKAWCYYESRILGAHHGLISTYALETLVLYIFHHFHSSLNGPLVVLYRFLDYFSKFDWNNYCISLNGPVSISSLPEIVAGKPENGGDDLLFSKEFLRNCVNMFCDPSRVHETNPRAFLKKHLNIVDPLKENNNLGRSISKGNFYRIRSAFTYGARKLGRILLLPGESIADELKKFFMNTLDRHGRGQKPNVRNPVLTFGTNGPGHASLFSGIETYTEDKSVLESPSSDSNGIAGKSGFGPQRSLYEGINNTRISGAEKKLDSRISNQRQRYFTKMVPSLIVLEEDSSANGNAVSQYCLAGDARDLATSKNQGLTIRNETCKSSPLSSEASTSPLCKAHHASRLYFTGLFKENGKIGNGNSDQTKPANVGTPETKVSSRLVRVPDEEKGSVLRQDLEENELKINGTIDSCSPEGFNPVGSTDGIFISSSVAAYPSEDLCPNYRDWDLAGTAGSPEALDSLADLRGDYDSHSRSLQYGQLFHECALSVPVVPNPPSSSQYRNKNTWDTLHRSVQFKWNVFSRMNVNGVEPFFPVNPPIVSGAAFGVEMAGLLSQSTSTLEILQMAGPLSQSTSTLEILQNHHSYRERPSPGRRRNQASANHSQLQRHPRNNGRAAAPAETYLLEKGGLELSPAQFPVLPGCGKPGSSDFHQSGRSAMRGLPHANGFLLPSECIKFGSFVLPLGVYSLDENGQPDSDSSHTQGSIPSLPTPEMQRLRPVGSTNQERIAVQSYHLKDEDDFPPLSI